MKSICLALVSGVLSVTIAAAQAPGSRCVTDQGWCWASPPGDPGDACVCPNPNGFGTIPGTLR